LPLTSSCLSPLPRHRWKTNAPQERRDSPLVPKLLAMHRTLMTKAPHPFYRFTGVLMRSSHAGLQRGTPSLFLRHSNDVIKEKRMPLHQKILYAVHIIYITRRYNTIYVYNSLHMCLFKK